MDAVVISSDKLNEVHSEIRHSEISPGGKTPPRFLADGMLGSLAVKLRILGFDTAYDKQSRDVVLMERAISESRILLTSDRELFRQSVKNGIGAIVITGPGDFASLVEIFHALAIHKLDRTMQPRCSSCNSTLDPTGREDRWGRPMFECTNCSKLYWRGSHWKKLENLFESVNRKLVCELRNKIQTK